MNRSENYIYVIGEDAAVVLPVNEEQLEKLPADEKLAEVETMDIADAIGKAFNSGNSSASEDQLYILLHEYMRRSQAYSTRERIGRYCIVITALRAANGDLVVRPAVLMRMEEGERYQPGNDADTQRLFMRFMEHFDLIAPLYRRDEYGEGSLFQMMENTAAKCADTAKPNKPEEAEPAAHKYSVGDAFPMLPPNGQPVGPLIIMNGPVFATVYWLDNIDEQLANEWESGEYRYGVYVNERIPFLLSAFPGGGLYFDASLNILKEADAGREPCDLILGKSVIHTLFLVNAENNTLRAIRQIGIGPTTEKTLLETIKEQIKHYNRGTEVESEISRIYSQVTIQDMFNDIDQLFAPS